MDSLNVNDPVEVISAASGEVEVGSRGRITAIGDGEITLEVDGERVTIPATHVRRLPGFAERVRKAVSSIGLRDWLVGAVLVAVLAGVLLLLPWEGLIGEDGSLRRVFGLGIPLLLVLLFGSLILVFTERLKEEDYAALRGALQHMVRVTYVFGFTFLFLVLSPFLFMVPQLFGPGPVATAAGERDSLARASVDGGPFYVTKACTVSHPRPSGGSVIVKELDCERGSPQWVFNFGGVADLEHTRRASVTGAGAQGGGGSDDSQGPEPVRGGDGDPAAAGEAAAGDVAAGAVAAGAVAAGDVAAGDVAAGDAAAGDAAAGDAAGPGDPAMQDGQSAQGGQAGQESQTGEGATSPSSRNPLPIAQQEHIVRLSGGLVVPVYFIFIAVAGAVVGMLRRIPEIQRRSFEWIAMNDEARAISEEALPIGKAREYLVFQIVQVATAPFIGLLVYAMVNPESTVTTTAVAFAAGFSSEPFLLIVRDVSDRLSGNAGAPK